MLWTHLFTVFFFFKLSSLTSIFLWLDHFVSFFLSSIFWILKSFSQHHFHAPWHFSFVSQLVHVWSYVFVSLCTRAYLYCLSPCDHRPHVCRPVCALPCIVYSIFPPSICKQRDSLTRIDHCLLCQGSSTWLDTFFARLYTEFQTLPVVSAQGGGHMKALKIKINRDNLKNQQTRKGK